MISGANDDKAIIVRSLEFTDVDSVAKLHLRSFPDFFLSFLGIGFLRKYYKCIVDYSQFGVVATRNSEIIGFSVGIDSCFGFYQKLLKTRWFGFALAALPAIVKKPSILPRLIGALSKRPPVETDCVSTVHLTSIGVIPELFGKGVGQLLLREFSSLVSQRGFNRIVLETDAENNERVFQFYRKEGFCVRRDFVTPQGRKMFEFEKNL